MQTHGYLPVQTKHPGPFLCVMQLKAYPRSLIVWSVINAIAIVLHLIGSSALWKFHLHPGDRYAAGPGDGLYFLLLVLLPWFGMMIVNVGVTIGVLVARWSKPWRKVQLTLVGSWLMVAAFELYAIRLPEGVEYMWY